MLATMPSWKEAASYGEAVKAVLDEHGCTFRSQRQRTGLPHSTVGGWVNDGIPPSEEKALQFARGFGLPEDEWLKKARRGPLMSPANVYKLLNFDLFELTAGLEIPMRRAWFHGGQDEAFITREQAVASILRHVDDLIADYPDHHAPLNDFKLQALKYTQ